MKTVLASAALLVLGAAPAIGPVGPAHSPGDAWICDLARDWKAIMLRDHPGADRSIPDVERRCHLPQER